MTFWFWVAKRDAIIGHKGCWGDCGPDVKPGEFSFIYHKSPLSRIQELAIIKSVATPDCQIKTQKGFTITGHCCEYEIVHEFVYPLTYQEMNANQILNDWIATNQNLQGMYFSIDELIWNLIEDRLKEKNENYSDSHILDV